MPSKKDNHDRSESINLLQEMVHQHDPTFFPMMNVTLDASKLEKNWKQAKQALKQPQQNARDLQYQSYKELLEASEYNIYIPETVRRAKIIKSTIRTEKCREMHRQIRLSAKPMPEQARCINSIFIPGDVPHNRETTEPTLTELAENPAGPTSWNTVIDWQSDKQHLLEQVQQSILPRRFNFPMRGWSCPG
jgi:hypothetical protein